MKQNQADWQPLLSGELRTSAHHVVAEIAERLSHSQTSEDSADLALFFAYRERANPQPARAAYFLEQAVARISQEEVGAGLFGGLAGTGWVLAHLAGWVYDADEDDPNDTIDEVLCAHLAPMPWTHNFDLINGLVGIGLYALERRSKSMGRRLLERVIKLLAEMAETTRQGITWHTPANLLPTEQCHHFPSGYYNLGLAHGVPGVIALLGRVVAARVALARAQPLLEGAVRWLLAQDSDVSPNQGTAGFPDILAEQLDTKPARLAWCYGDVGIAAALLGTARCVDQPQWEESALRIARRAARRPPDESGVHDACLCHGAAGLAHQFNRFYQATGDPLFATQARYWFEQTLMLRQPQQGVAGYRFWQGDEGWEDSRGFLEGAAGIGLALLAACNYYQPAWDRLLLVDIPG